MLNGFSRTCRIKLGRELALSRVGAQRSQKISPQSRQWCFPLELKYPASGKTDLQFLHACKLGAQYIMLQVASSPQPYQIVERVGLHLPAATGTGFASAPTHLQQVWCKAGAVPTLRVMSSIHVRSESV